MLYSGLSNLQIPTHLLKTMSQEDNISKQADEIEALSAIYGDDWKVINERKRKYAITIKHSDDEHSPSILLEVMLPNGYPNDVPPIYEFSAPWLRGEKRRDIDNALNYIYFENSGENIIYMWVEKLREFLSEKSDEGEKEPETVNENRIEEDGCEGNFDWSNFSAANNETSASSGKDKHEGVCECPEIFHGEIVSDRKSKFMAHLAKVYYKEQPAMVLDKLCENRKVASATHNIYAYRILREEEGKRPLIYQGSEDDGETHAGNRMLHLLQIIDCQNVMVVVTRWYGGVHLGPDRFKHISSLTRIILEEHGYIRDAKKDNKKTSKKK